MIGVVAKTNDEASRLILDLRMPDAIPLTYSPRPLVGNARFDALVFCGSVSQTEAEKMTAAVPVKTGHVYTLNRVAATELDEGLDQIRQLGALS